MKKIVIYLAFISVGALAGEKAEIHYSGLGRYTCTGDSFKCAQIDANNRALESWQRAKDNVRIESEREQRRRDLELYTGSKSR